MSKPNLLQKLAIPVIAGVIGLIGVQSNAQAGILFKTTVERVPPPPIPAGAIPTHDGDWFYDVQIVPGTPPMVKFTVKKTPGKVFLPDGTEIFDNDMFLGDMFTYNATESDIFRF